MTSIESAAKTCIPDVFIAGGMKCGSSSLHRSLSRHPDVWMPEDEQYLMDFDDTNVHPEFVDSHGSDRPERDALRYICSAYQARFTTSAPSSENGPRLIYIPSKHRLGSRDFVQTPNHYSPA